MKCDAGIRSFRPINETETRCALEPGHTGDHEGHIRDYAYPGSVTVLHWMEPDRRNFHGEWPGDCPEECILPLGHGGRHAPP